MGNVASSKTRRADCFRCLLPHVFAQSARGRSGLVAQIFNLLYRRFVIGRPPSICWRAELSHAPQNAILRYSHKCPVIEFWKVRFTSRLQAWRPCQGGVSDLKLKLRLAQRFSSEIGKCATMTGQLWRYSRLKIWVRGFLSMSLTGWFPRAGPRFDMDRA